MLDREAAEALFLEHLAWINRAASAACARYGVVGPDAEDVASRVRMEMMKDDYGVVKRFQGTSTMKSYLATVVSNHVFDFIRNERGRWRPSAAAERLGPPVPVLEEMVLREGYTIQQAGEKLRTAGQTTLSDIELARKLAQVPDRSPLRPVVREPSTGPGLDGAPSASQADERVNKYEADRLRAAVFAALEMSMQQLEPADRVIVQMHFEQGLTLASVARALNLDQKRLYRHFDRLLVRLRSVLEDAGFDEDAVRAFLQGADAP